MAEFRLTVVPYHRSLRQLRRDGPQGLDPKILAEELREHGSAALPGELETWLCDYLGGNISPRRGRPRMDPLERRTIRLVRAAAYRRYLDWLQARRKRDGHLDGWSCIREAGWWDGPPAERAARMVAERFGPGHLAWRTILTELSDKSG